MNIIFSVTEVRLVMRRRVESDKVDVPQVKCFPDSCPELVSRGTGDHTGNKVQRDATRPTLQSEESLHTPGQPARRARLLLFIARKKRKKEPLPHSCCCLAEKGAR
ncbi:hypothetical protein E2C01_052758 [Portunus trituberculatus]|uniref:Uncharacterized protein n=1 Tax=Portunus trituberculatus TaxID=210409 RepID=A0A5B7GMC0_PORTR|nr:hypothetical protein [Portunus trituberculatus]